MAVESTLGEGTTVRVGLPVSAEAVWFVASPGASPEPTIQTASGPSVSELVLTA